MINSLGEFCLKNGNCGHKVDISAVGRKIVAIETIH